MVVRRFGTVALAASALFASACVTDSASIYIAGGVPIDTAGCTYAASTGSFSAGSTADVALGASFGQSVYVGFVVQSLVRQRSFAIATDPSTIHIESAEISLADTSGASIGSSFTVDVVGTVPGSPDGMTPGTGVIVVPVVPAAAMAGLAGITSATTVVAQITLHGRTNGHIEVEGGPFNWIVTLLPAGSRGVPCAVGEAVSCCAPGQDSEFYCTTNGPGCAPQ